MQNPPYICPMVSVMESIYALALLKDHFTLTNKLFREFITTQFAINRN